MCRPRMESFSYYALYTVLIDGIAERLRLIYPMHTHKTRKSIAKRFKVTGRGKVLRRSPGKRHLLRKRTTKQKRRASHDKSVSKGISKVVRMSAPGMF